MSELEALVELRDILLEARERVALYNIRYGGDLWIEIPEGFVPGIGVVLNEFGHIDMAASIECRLIFVERRLHELAEETRWANANVV